MIPRWRLPPLAPGARIGLYGGSFNPPHAAHRLVADQAMKRLGLDRVWWLVTPGNPLKNVDGLPPIAARIAQVRGVAGHARQDVTGFEQDIGARFSHDTIVWLQRRFPGVRFVWIMGGDSMATLHRWHHWRDIMRRIPVAVIDRPGQTLAATASVAARTFAAARLPEAEARRLATAPTPAWVLLHGPRSPLSSTALRASAGQAHAVEISPSRDCGKPLPLR
ncbi:putative nicotinate-nucleotide adenylyltransferase [Camelimonas fluminis]|uniref:Probable nicotinate-nucleotide adenylyltransferase n=1 Tax=Camelimonas fluminis TaxID=1576911 RepID=A0ABV7UPJ5_9HYPH|nr:nicotinate-nucleotide adenylyltransferase [Camelimonas fluminis]GHE69224.1 putative nicotinate-nucleotide adenylyltransferase [Camelimonas fluminis]